MPLVLRGVKQPKWYKQKARPFLLKGDVPADPFGDLPTRDNKLSVWIVKDDRSNLERIITALAVTRYRPDKFDYLLFDAEILSVCGISIKESRGGTLDSGVNVWHRDLVELSGLKLLDLVKGILNSNYQTGRFHPKKILQLIAHAIASGRIAKDKLPQRFQANSQ